MFKKLPVKTIWISAGMTTVAVLVIVPLTIYLLPGPSLAEPEAVKKTIIVDTDPGVDDSMALMMLLANEETSNITAISLVHGNAELEQVTKNLIRTLTVANRSDIPVYKGADQGLVYKQNFDNQYYGIDGFGETTSESILLPVDIKEKVAANFLVDHVKSKPNEVTILAQGPLTNIALAISLYPDFMNNINELIVLGGSYQGEGNIRPGVEFNFFCDPEAAQLVLSKATPEKPITLIPVEAVRKAAFPMDWRKNVLGKINSTSIEFLNKIEEYSLKDSELWTPYDPVAASLLINPAIISDSIMVTVNVLCCQDIGRGVTVTDYNSDRPNIKLITEINKDLLQDILLVNLSK